MNTKKLIASCWMIVLVASANAQNINNPNRLGPMGTEVNTLSGNLFIPRTDMYIPGRGLDIDITFYYNSYLLLEDVGFGKGWSFAYAIQYKKDTVPGRRLIVWGDGREDAYDSLGAGNYKTPRGFFGKFEEYETDKFRLTETDKTVYFFDNKTHRKITRIQDINGNFLNFNYTDSLLTSLVNGAGQSISFTYNAAGRLTQTTDANLAPSRTYTYSYEPNGNLKEVTDPLGGKLAYTYLINGPMAGITDKNSNKVNIIYAADFSTSEIIGCNKRISFSYDSTSKTTVVTNHLQSGNQVTKYNYEKIDSVSWIKSVSGNCCGFNLKYEYDTVGNLTKMIDANGLEYNYTYDDRGNTLTATDPLGGISSFTYTPLNMMASSKDPKGNVYTMSYDASGNLTQLVTPGNNIYTAVYNTAKDIISSTDPKGNTYTYNYDAYGYPTTVSGPDGYHATLAFDARGKLLSYTDARGNSKSAEYDILGQLKKVTDPINNSMEFSYDAAGNIISYKNQNNEVSSYGYDASNRMVRVTGPTGSQAEFAFDEMDNMVLIKSAIGNEMKMGYDNLNRLNSIRLGDDHITTFTYDANGNAISATLPNGNRFEYTYDQLNRVTSVSDADGVMLRYSYDKNDNITSYTNGTGAVTTATYDSLDRVKQVTDALGNSFSFVYDRNDNIISVTDREGKTSLYTYDALNRVKTQTDNNGSVITVGYDAQDNITSLTDQNNNITTYSYDSLNRRKVMTYPDGKYQQYYYDKKGNLSLIRLTDATTISFQYDTLNRLTTKLLPNGEVYSYTYDRVGRVTSTTNSNGTVYITYDHLGRVASESNNGRVNNYSYDIAGRTQTTVYPDSTEVTKVYDHRNRVIKVMKDNVTLVEYNYNNANQLLKKSFSNGLTTNFQYDFANRLSNITTGTIQNTSYVYDKEYNITAVINNRFPSLSQRFVYDNGYRLLNYKQGPDGSPLVENSYNYDAVGNRVSANLNGVATTYSVNNLNQLTGVNGVIYTFDERGNITYDGSYFKTYDPENRLIKDSASPVNVIQYQYDPLNRRISKNSNGTISRYTYSGAKIIEERDANNNPLNRTIFTGFLSPLLNEKTGNRFFYHDNQSGSVEALTDSNGRLIERYQYDVFGRQTRTDSLGNVMSSSITGNRFGFTGQEYDSATSSYRFFYRNYSPTTGVFNQRDLIEYGDGMGMYQYVANNPANGIDIWGLEDCPPRREEIGYKISFSNEVIGKLMEKGVDINTMLKNANHKEWLNIHKAEYKRLMEKSIEARFNTTGKNVGGKGTANYHSNAAKSHMKGINNAEANIKANNKVGDINAKGADNFGKGMNVIDNLVKGEAFASSLVDGQSNEQYTQEVQAGGDFALSLLGWTPPGAAYGTADFVVETVTGKGITQHTADFGEFLGNQYDDSMERDREAYEYAKSMGKGKEWLEARRRMADRQRQTRERKVKCPEGGTRKPGRWVYDPIAKMWILVPIDPNLIIGPDGVGEKKWISVKDRMPYTILYENDTSATAPAKYVRISTKIEPKQDPLTLELGSFGFNLQSFDIPAGTVAYYTRLDVRDSANLYVDLTAGYDQMKNEIFWEFQSIDPITLLPSEEPLAGFLFLQDKAKPEYGNGFVNFSIKPRTDAITLDTIGALAKIVFDSNDTIPTNTHTNTIDAFAPVSQLNDLPPVTPDTEISLQLTGSDDTGGVGLKSYSIYVSDNGGAAQPWLSEFAKSDTIFRGEAGHLYRFYISAVDSVGNRETLRLADSVLVTNGEQVICPGSNVEFDSRASGSIQWQVDAGSGYVNITEGGLYTGVTSSVLTVNAPPTSMYGYRYRAVVNGNAGEEVFLLKFGIEWEGTVSDAWENPANWSCGALPDMNTDVTVNGGKTHQPVVRSNVTIRSLRVNPGASGTISNGSNLTILK